jgi:L-methionine (R)-S-oxide reductase
MKDANDKPLVFDSLFGSIKQILDDISERDEKLASISWLLVEKVPHYDWVGFYIVDENARNQLVLGPYAGNPTEHERIVFGKGICGQVAESKETFVVQDVSKELNYLPCNPNVKSEVVVPILKNGEIVGELDIDSNALSPFSQEDKEFLEAVCMSLSEIF